jgi:hypothetical protein
MAKIGLFTNFSKENPPTPMTGCWKVFNNLIAGLNQLNIKVSLNQKEEMNGCLDGGALSDHLPGNTLIGPEIMVLPTEMLDPWKKWKYWTQPAQWVVDYMRTFQETKDNMMFVWPVGVDTERFNDLGRNKSSFKHDCFIYYKNVTKQTPESKLNWVKSELEKRYLSYKVFSYGSYGEEEFVKATKECKFGIFLTGTESQGLAVMEVMSCGVPIYVFDEKTFLYGDYTFSNNNVSSCAYFDNKCGVRSTDNTFNTFDNEFIKKIDTYDPRSFIVDNHSLKAGAKRYFDILTHIKNVK